MMHDAKLNARGGAAVAVLSQMEAWEACLVLNLRLWCTGPEGQAEARAEYMRALPGEEARRAWHGFDTLMRTIIDTAWRPMVRHDVGCSCVGSDECIFLHMVRTAAEGHLNDAALIATLMTGPAHAERIALLAGDVGENARILQNTHSGTPKGVAPKVVRLH